MSPTLSPRLALLAACLLSPLAVAQDAVPLATVWHQRSLDNGLRAVAIEAPDASDQVTFTLLPWGFLAEEAGQPGQAHMVEHLLVRSSSPEQVGPLVDGVLLNGETMALSQRLESFGPVETWREGVAHHGRWLALDGSADRQALEAVLSRERLAMLTELDQTQRSGETHKWALSAWNQVLRHGATHVGVRRAVTDVQLGPLLDAIDRRLVAGPAVQVVSVGPAPVEEVLAELESVLGDLPSGPWEPVPASVPVEQVLAPGLRRATWDLPRLHYMVWYPLPDEGPADRAAGDALAFLISSRIQQRGTLNQLGVSAYASADVVTPEGRFLMISAAAPATVDQGRLAGVLEEIVASLSLLPEAQLLVGDMAIQLGQWPDFAELRARMAGRPGLEWIEAQQALFLLYAQQNMSLDVTSLPLVYGRLTAEGLSQLASRWLVPAKRSTLWLTQGT